MCCRISIAVDGPVEMVGGGALTAAAASESTATIAERSAYVKCLPDIVSLLWEWLDIRTTRAGGNPYGDAVEILTRAVARPSGARARP